MPRKRLLWLICALVLLIGGIYVRVGRPQGWDYGFDRPVSGTEAEQRLAFVSAAEAWLGSDEGSDGHRTILEIYNSHEPLAQGYTVLESDNWCAAFVSAVAIDLELTHLIPTECGCQRQIGLWQEMQRWEEQDDYIPLPGDIIYYCNTDRSRASDCTGWSDHVGIVVGTCNGYIKVIEGNCNNTVMYRYIRINSPGIRGFGLPDYSAEVA